MGRAAVTAIGLVMAFVAVVALGARARGALPRGVHAPGWASVSVGSPLASRGDIYAVVFDAGSTASRAHCFRFEPAGAQPELIRDSFAHTSPGLSSFANSPSSAARSLQPLLSSVGRCVPKAKKASTPLNVKATAGLRALPDNQADAIVDAVSQRVRKSGFFKPSVEIIDGSDEGSFQWVAVNYLLGRLRSGVDAGTTGVVDLGGESVQVAFELPESAPKPDEDIMNKYVRRLAGKRVYVSSWPALGMNAVRARIAQGASSLGSSACFKSGDEGSFSRHGQQVQYKGTQETASASHCERETYELLQMDTTCETSGESQCSFGGHWSGSAPSVLQWHLSSFFFDAALEAGIISAEARKDGSAQAEISSLRQAAEVECSGKRSAPGVSQTLCVDLSYAHALLTEGLSLPESLTVTFLKEVSYRGQLIEAAWPLGSAVSRLLSER